MPEMPGPERVRVAPAIGLRHEQEREAEEHGAARGERQVHGPPAERHVDDAADDGGEDRRQRHGRAHVAEDAGGPLGLVEVADHRAPDHRAAPRAERLEETAGDEERGRRRRPAGEPAHHVHDEPAQEDAAPADAVGERTVDELGHGEPREEQRHRQLRRSRAAPRAPPAVAGRDGSVMSIDSAPIATTAVSRTATGPRRRSPAPTAPPDGGSAERVDPAPTAPRSRAARRSPRRCWSRRRSRRPGGRGAAPAGGRGAPPWPRRPPARRRA